MTNILSPLFGRDVVVTLADKKTYFGILLNADHDWLCLEVSGSRTGRDSEKEVRAVTYIPRFQVVDITFDPFDRNTDQVVAVIDEIKALR